MALYKKKILRKHITLDSKASFVENKQIYRLNNQQYILGCPKRIFL